MSFILALLKKLIPGNPYLLAGVAAAAFSAGGWTVYKFVKSGQVSALEQAIEDQQAYYQKESRVQAETQAKALKRANERSTVREVIRYVKDDPDCDLPPAVAGVLDARVQGRPLDTGDSTIPTAGITGVSQSQSLNALDYAAEQFYGCRDQLKGINDRLQSCSVLCD